jgi:hypothetical protein
MHRFAARLAYVFEDLVERFALDHVSMTSRRRLDNRSVA